MTMRILGVAVLCLGLTGCFTSPKALIESAQAEFPVTAPMEIGDLHADGTSSLRRLEKQDGVYVLVDPNGTKDGKPAREVKHRFVVRGIGDGLFVVQRFPDSGALQCPCTFGLLEMKDRRVAVFDFDNFGSAPQLNEDEMVRFGVTVESGSYQLSSFEKTAALFRLLLERPRPDDVYQLK